MSHTLRSLLWSSLLLGGFAAFGTGCARPIPASGAPCAVLEDCASGQVCQVGACVTPPPSDVLVCVTDDDCSVGANQACLSGVCVDGGSGASCSTTAECPITEFCNVGTNRCVPMSAGMCRDSSQCTNAQTPRCNETPGGTGSLGRCGQCSSAADCDGGSCLNGFCTDAGGGGGAGGGGAGGGGGGGGGDGTDSGCTSAGATCQEIFTDGFYCVNAADQAPPADTVDCTDTGTCPTGYECILGGQDAGFCLETCSTGGGGGGGGDASCVDFVDCLSLNPNLTCEAGQCVCDALFLSAFCPGGVDEAICDCAGGGGGGGAGGSDPCAEFGWYGDGECDTFCPEPDPDCSGSGGGGGGGGGGGTCTDASLTCTPVTLGDSGEEVSICTASDGAPPPGALSCSDAAPCASGFRCLSSDSLNICVETC